MTTLKPVDIVIVGFGWAGGIIARELAPTGLRIVALERGIARDTVPDFLEPAKDDEIRFSSRNELVQDLSRETITFRNTSAQTALPMRQLGSFLPGEGVGGAGVHWGGMAWRLTEWDHAAKSRTVDRYGASIIPADMIVQDWDLSYAELEPCYDRFEKMAGISGRAGNLRGRKIRGGNVLEAPRAHEYPNPPLVSTQSMAMFEKAANDLGYNPFPAPAANASRDYTNPDGVAFGQCHYCGFCEGYGCEANAKASPHFTVLPIARSFSNFELRTSARVLKVNLDSTGRKATGVTYVDALGREIVQPADIVVLSAFGLGNVHLMLHSGIGKPYDPASGQGVVGRGYSYQATGGGVAFFDKATIMNPFMGAGAASMCIDNFNADHFDFAEAGYIGGGVIQSYSPGGRPIGWHPTPPGTPRWGSAWKRAVVDNYNHSTVIGTQGGMMGYRQNYLDLDPTYRDAYGRPMLRMTFDFQPNEIRQMRHNVDIVGTIGKAMGAREMALGSSPVPYSIVPYQSTHNAGGAILGSDPATSAVNRYLQAWDVPNVFLSGACVFPQNPGKNPTGAVGALAYWTADAIRKRYLRRPGELIG